MPFTIAIGAGLGVLKNQQDMGQQSTDRDLAAAQIAYSPWTKIDPNEAIRGISKVNPVGTIGQGAVAGAQFGAQLQNIKTNKAINQWLEHGYTPFGNGGSAQYGDFGPGAAAINGSYSGGELKKGHLGYDSPYSYVPSSYNSKFGVIGPQGEY